MKKPRKISAEVAAAARRADALRERRARQGPSGKASIYICPTLDRILKTSEVTHEMVGPHVVGVVHHHSGTAELLDFHPTSGAASTADVLPDEMWRRAAVGAAARKLKGKAPLAAKLASQQVEPPQEPKTVDLQAELEAFHAPKEKSPKTAIFNLDELIGG